MGKLRPMGRALQGRMVFGGDDVGYSMQRVAMRMNRFLTWRSHVYKPPRNGFPPAMQFVVHVIKPVRGHSAWNMFGT